MNESMSHPLDASFAYSLVLFTIGIVVSSILVLATYAITRRTKFRGPVYADISKLALDRIVLNSATAILILMECATLLWDNLSYAQFPVLLRWPVDILAVAAIAFSSLRLITQYVRIHNEINNGQSVCPKTGFKCTAKPNDKFIQLKSNQYGN